MLGIVAAGVAGPALLLLYFLKLRRRPVRVSTVLFWEQAVQDLQVNAPFRWIRPSWLLLLHLLVLACLCFAAARPAIEGGEGFNDRVILLIDRSASMSASDGASGEPGQPRQSRLDAAKRKAMEAIRSISDAGNEAMVIAFASRPVVVSNYTGSASLLRRAVESIEPTDQPGSLEEALKMVAAFASASGSDGPEKPPSLVLLTDGAGSLPAGVSIPGLGSVQIRLVQVGSAPGVNAGNIGIVAMNARRDFRDPGMVRVFVRVQSTLQTPASIALRGSLNGQQSGLAAIEVPAAPKDGVSDVSHSFEARTVDGGVFEVSFERSDALESDNRAALVLEPSRPLRMVLVRPAGPADVPGEDLREALAALESVDPVAGAGGGGVGGVGAAASLRVVSIDEFTRSGLGPDRTDLVVFDRVRPEALPGAVATMSFGAGLPLPGVRLGAPAAESSGFTQWARAHPVMRYVTLADVVVDVQRPVVTTEELPKGMAAVPLAWTSEGAAVVFLEQGPVRRIIVGFSLGDSTWARDLSFPTFIANAVDTLALRGDQAVARSWGTDEVVEVVTPAGAVPGSSLPVVRAAGPATGGVSNAAVDEQSAVVGEDGLTTLGVLPRVGVYRLGASGPEVAVNLLNPAESEVRTRGAVDIAGRTVTTAASGRPAPREIWAWFVLGAMVLLTLEWFVFAWRSRV